MFCPGCGLQVSDDLKFCRQCGANLRGVREAMTPGSTGEKFDWSKTWVADMFLSEEERERRRGVTPEEKRLNEIKATEEKRLNEIKGGVITGLAGIGAMIFLYFFLGIVAKGESARDAEILRNVWLAGVVPFLIGAGLLFNGLFISRRLVKLKEEQAQTALPTSPAPTAHPTPLPAALPAKTTDQLVAGAAPSAGYSVIEDTTAHLPEPVAAPTRRETG
ncbi:MAG: zinc ribbon domain-containing protein [Blastocatellia bacterium]